jgi:hypothetical protein
MTYTHYGESPQSDNVVALIGSASAAGEFPEAVKLGEEVDRTIGIGVYGLLSDTILD